MTRACMPGRGAPLRVVEPPRCALAESLSDAERAMLAELGVHAPPPRLHLVPRRAAGAAPAADLRRARRRELVDGLVMWAVLAFSVACAAIAAVSHFAEVMP